jgi:hypothetical protein
VFARSRRRGRFNCRGTTSHLQFLPEVEDNNREDSIAETPPPTSTYLPEVETMIGKIRLPEHHHPPYFVNQHPAASLKVILKNWNILYQNHQVRNNSLLSSQFHRSRPLSLPIPRPHHILPIPMPRLRVAGNSFMFITKKDRGVWSGSTLEVDLQVTKSFVTKV